MENRHRWSKTPLFIHYLEENNQYIEKIFLNYPIYVMEKIDGTNVGIDELGNIYGRIYMVEKNTKTYQLTSLDTVRTYQIRAESIKKYFESIFNFSDFTCIIYGELISDPNLYAYSKLPTYCPFGVVLTNLNETQIGLIETDFDFKKNDNGQITLYMNDKLYKLMIDHKCNIVGYLGKYDNFSDFLTKKFEWLFKGMGEGVIINMNSDTYKLKIGKEINFTNLGILNKNIEMDISDKIKEIIMSLIHIQKSKYKNGEIVDDKKNVQINKEKEILEEAIKSAMTKFDHENTFYESGVKGFNKYVEIIFKECKKDVENITKKVIKSILGPRFGIYIMKNKP